MITRIFATLVLAGWLALSIDASAHFRLSSHGSVASGSTQNVLTVSLTNENIAPNSAAGAVIGTLSATTDNGAFTGTFSMQTSGNSSDDGACATAANFQIVGNQLEVLNPSITGPQLLGGGYDTRGYPCVKATPTSGGALIREFSILVRGPTFVAMTPYSIQYTSPASAGSTLATLSTSIYGATPSPTYALGGSSACTGLTISGNLLKVGGSPYSGTGFCAINVTQAGVQNAAGGSTYAAGVYITQGTYQGPGDLQSYQAWGGLRCFDAAVATGSQKSIKLIRDSDLAKQDINCLSNGDLDYASAASFCVNSFCYVYHYYDQSGHGNDEESWQEYQFGNVGGNYQLVWLPPFIFNCNNTSSLACILSQNSNDRLFQNVSFSSSSATGTLTSVLLNPISELQQFMTSNCTSNASPCPGLYAANGTNAISAGTNTGGVGSVSGPSTAGLLNTWYALAGGINGASSFINANGTIATGTVPSTTLGSTLTIAGSFGGGGFGNGGLMEEWGLSFTVFSDQGHSVCLNESGYWNFTASC